MPFQQMKRSLSSLETERAIVRAKLMAASSAGAPDRTVAELAVYEALVAEQAAQALEEEREEATALLMAALRIDDWA